MRVAVGTDALADLNEPLPDLDSEDRRGWWGDLDAEAIWGGWPIGSKNWLLMRAKISDKLSWEGDTVVRAKAYNRAALQPFIDRRICSRIEVEAVRVGRDEIDVHIVMYRGPETTDRAALSIPMGSRSPASRSRSDQKIATSPDTHSNRNSHALENADAPQGARDGARRHHRGLYGAAFIGNNVLRVMADTMAGLAHHVLRYIDWLALQLLPDTAEVEWLDRHGQIWLVNADGTIGRKLATYAQGIVTMTGTVGAVVPAATQLVGNGIGYETMTEIVIGADAATECGCARSMLARPAMSLRLLNFVSVPVERRRRRRGGRARRRHRYRDRRRSAHARALAHSPAADGWGRHRLCAMGARCAWRHTRMESTARDGHRHDHGALHDGRAARRQ